jgi:HPt (histidine-containing phosphotransfer) domain-containing protein
MQAAAGEPPVDFDQLVSAASDDPEILLELVKLYFDQAKEIMEGLTEALQKQSARDVDYLAHKLAGASLACGMTAVVAPIRGLEINARKGDLTGAEALLAESVSRLELVRVTVEEYVANQKKP